MATPTSIPSYRGYPKLASFMGDFPDVAIFRRFGYLTILNLMLLQNELADLELKLHKQIRDDNKSPTKSDYSISLSIMIEQEKLTSPTDPSQLRLLEEIRKKLIEYSQSLFWLFIFHLLMV